MLLAHARRRQILKATKPKRFRNGTLKALEMCVVETRRVLEAEPKQAIHANMGGPNQPIREQPKLFVKDRECDEQQGYHKRMDQVIKSGTKSYTQQIA